MCTSEAIMQKLDQKDYLLYLCNQHYGTKYVELSWNEIFELIQQQSNPTIYNLHSCGLLVVYNCATQQSKQIYLVDKQVCRTGSVWILYKQRILVTGGIHRKDADMDRVYRVDPILGTVVQQPNMVYNHNSHAMALCLDEVYVLGGVSPYIMRQVEKLLASETWEEVQELPHPMEYLSAIGHKGEIYIASTDYSSLCIYNPKEDNYSVLQMRGLDNPEWDMIGLTFVQKDDHLLLFWGNLCWTIQNKAFSSQNLVNKGYRWYSSYPPILLNDTIYILRGEIEIYKIEFEN